VKLGAVIAIAEKHYCKLTILEAIRRKSTRGLQLATAPVDGRKFEKLLLLMFVITFKPILALIAKKMILWFLNLIMLGTLKSTT
jgi:hypothetical protein